MVPGALRAIALGRDDEILCFYFHEWSPLTDDDGRERRHVTMATPSRASRTVHSFFDSAADFPEVLTKAMLRIATPPREVFRKL